MSVYHWNQYIVPVQYIHKLPAVAFHCCGVGMRKMQRNVVLTVVCATVVVLLLVNLQMNWTEKEQRTGNVVRVYNTHGKAKVERVDSKEILDDTKESFEDTDEVSVAANGYLTAGSFDLAQYKFLLKLIQSLYCLYDLEDYLLFV